MSKPKKKTVETITIRPTRAYKGISGKIKTLASRDKRSLNDYVLILFEKHATENGL